MDQENLASIGKKLLRRRSPSRRVWIVLAVLALVIAIVTRNRPSRRPRLRQRGDGGPGLHRGSHAGRLVLLLQRLQPASADNDHGGMCCGDRGFPRVVPARSRERGVGSDVCLPLRARSTTRRSARTDWSNDRARRRLPFDLRTTTADDFPQFLGPSRSLYVDRFRLAHDWSARSQAPYGGTILARVGPRFQSSTDMRSPWNSAATPRWSRATT